MSDGPLQRLNRIGHAALRLNAALERLPPASMTPTALKSLAADPGALLDDLLAPLLEHNTSPAAEEDQDTYATTSMAARPTLLTSNQTAPARPHALNNRATSRSRSRATRPGTGTPLERPLPNIDMPSAAQQAPHDWEHSRQRELPYSPQEWPAGPAARQEQALFDVSPGRSMSDQARPFSVDALDALATHFDWPARQPEIRPAPPTHDNGAAQPGKTSGGEEIGLARLARSPAITDGDAPSQGLRLARGGIGLNALLRAHIGPNNNPAAPQNALPQPIDRGAPEGYANRQGDLAPYAGAALPARQDLPRHMPAAEAAALPARQDLPRHMPAAEAAAPPVPQPDSLDIAVSAAPPMPQPEALDIEEIMRELADRLEFEYLRMYGTSGD